jgi:hypothetical protein
MIKAITLGEGTTGKKGTSTYTSKGTKEFVKGNKNRESTHYLEIIIILIQYTNGMLSVVSKS